MVDVVIIGAGPYRLSVAAHLRHLRIPFRVFGKPITTAGLLELAADHVIAATEYKADIRRLSFLEPLRGEIAYMDGVPLLDQGFQSTARGLRFVGFVSAATFGPSMRFIRGTRFAARRVASTLSRAGTSRVGVTPLNLWMPA